MKISAKQKQKHLKHNVPDGGWGWMIVLGSTIIMSLVNNLHVSYGVMFSGWYNDLGVSSTMVGIILNTNCVLWTMMYLFVGPLTEQFGWRGLGIVSNLMTALSLILSAFATSTTDLLLSYSILGGIFGGLSIGQIYIILPKFFDKHLGIANAFPMAGFSACQFVFPILIPFLQDQFGFKGSMLVLGGIVLHAVAAAALFQPPEWHEVIVHDENSNDDTEVYQPPYNLGSGEKSLGEKIVYDENSNVNEEVYQLPSNVGSGEKSLVEKIYDNKFNVDKEVYQPQNNLGSEEKNLELKKIYDNKSFVDTEVYQPPNNLGSGEKNIEEKNVYDKISNDDEDVCQPPNNIRSGEISFVGKIVHDENSNANKKLYQLPNNEQSEDKSLVEKISEAFLDVLKAIAKNLTILKKPSALIISLGFSLFISSTINYYGLVPFVIINAGYSLEDAGWVMSYGAFANFFARFSSGMLSDFEWFKVPIGYVGGTFMSFIAMVGFALTDDILCLKLFSVMQGFGHGAHMGLFSIVTKEIVGPDLHSACVGASGVMLSMGFLTLGPFLGLIKDLSGSYTATMLFMAVLNALSVLLWFLMPLAKSYELRQCNATDNCNDKHINP